ncbi:molybdate ABC transporter substrate-binding protein [Roseovarius sp. EL26]|uniref:molybdate ABC transporter substrate-binding protein n=1 Tax=Roseovarius sp. EL26 TaxID=2126672 RepID=UPI000EA21294|nr:molybdate ABC transporter substrate-binding protein [Roseovarius sp. EL26]
MKSVFSNFATLCLLLWSACWPGFAGAQPDVTVFAAASLRDALEEAVAVYPGEVAVSYGGSGQIARQVAQGAPADVVILANLAWMDWLEGQGVLAPDGRVDLLSNRLVLIGPKGSAPIDTPNTENLLRRLAGGRLAIGQVDGVPAGIYGRQWLEIAGFWPTLSPHLAQAENVRAALLWVSRQETPLGIVYASDAQADPSVDVIYDVPEGLHDVIIYPMAMVSGSNNAHASDFTMFLQGSRAREIFRFHGFLPQEGRK